MDDLAFRLRPVHLSLRERARDRALADAAPGVDLARRQGAALGPKRRWRVAVLALGLVSGAWAEDYPLFQRPDPEPTLALTLGAFDAPLYPIRADAPRVADWTRSGVAGDTTVVAGPDFTADSRFLIFSQGPTSPGVLVEQRPYLADGSAASFVLPAGLDPEAMSLIWTVGPNGKGHPIAVNRPELWWAGPSETFPGATLSLFGRELRASVGGPGLFVLLRSASGQDRRLQVLEANPYRIDVLTPDVPAGRYDVWVHAGRGGNLGWAGPLRIDVLAGDPFRLHSNTVVHVRDFGAVGDGVTDDTAAVKAAIDAAARRRPATVQFGAGIYLMRDSLILVLDIELRGEGRDKTTIRAAPGYATSGSYSLIFGHSEPDYRIGLRDLTLDGAENLAGRHHILSLRGKRHLRLEGLRIDSGRNTVDLHRNRFVRVVGCEISGAGLFLGESSSVRVENNRFLLTHGANSAVSSWAGQEVAVLRNSAEDADPTGGDGLRMGSGRFIVTLGHWGALRRFFVSGNRTIALAPAPGVGIDLNQGEQVLFEQTTTILTGQLLSASATVLEFPTSVPGSAVGRDAIIVRGLGTGQVRRVVAVSGRTATVEPAFRLPPDRSSTVSISSSQTDSVIYANVFDGKPGFETVATASVAVSLYGNCSQIIVAENQASRMRQGLVDVFLWPDTQQPGASGALFFNTVERNRLEGSRLGMRGVSVMQALDLPGSLGVLGNSVRQNTLTQLISNAVEVQHSVGQGKRAGDFGHTVIERNVFEGALPAVRVDGPVGAPGVVLRGNRFVRTGPSPGSGLVLGSGSANRVLLSQNVWEGLTAPAAADAPVPDAVPVPAGERVPASPADLRVTPVGP
jgi:hypothetical protein